MVETSNVNLEKFIIIICHELDLDRPCFSLGKFYFWK